MGRLLSQPVGVLINRSIMEPVKYKNLRKDHLQKLCNAGWTNSQLADFFGINKRTLYRWRNRYPELKVQMDAWKEEADQRVERSCYDSAIGYYKPEEKIFINKTKVIEKRPDGTTLEYDKAFVIRVDTQRWYEPNVTAEIFWLTNRKHGDWKRTRQETGADPLSIKILTMIKEKEKGNGKYSRSGGNGGAAEVQTAVTVERGMQIVE